MKQNTFLSICILCVIVATVGSDAYRVGEIHEFEITINFAEVRQSPDENVIWSPPDYGQWRIIWDDIWNDQAFSGHVIAGNLYTNSAGDYRTFSDLNQDPQIFLLGDGEEVDFVFKGPYWGNSNFNYALNSGNTYAVTAEPNSNWIRTYFLGDQERVMQYISIKNAGLTEALNLEDWFWGLEDDLDIYGNGWDIGPSIFPGVVEPYVLYSRESPLKIQWAATNQWFEASTDGVLSLNLRAIKVTN